MEFQIVVADLLHHENTTATVAELNNKRGINSIRLNLTVLLCFLIKNSNEHKIHVLMKSEPCIILNLFLNFSDFDL